MPQSSSQPILNEVLASAEKLPAFPNIIGKVIPLIERMAPVNEIEAVIKFDQAITAKILALSQSSYYARRQTISSLRDAIVLLGQNQLNQVILSACSARYLDKQFEGYDLQEGEAWQHGVAVALMSDLVSKQIGLDNALTIYTAALLHDIGKTVLSLFVERYSDSILSLVKTEKMRFLDAERQVCGVDHQQLGAIIAHRWHFPPEVVTAIGYHHRPQEAKEHQDIVATVYVANRMVLGMGIGSGMDGFFQPNQDEVFTKLGITTRMVEKFMADLFEALEETKTFLAA
jgi:putative nucleotidyltransferase with HDIG domain